MGRNLHELMHAVTLAMPGWIFAAPPVPFTWAPDRHLRARLRNGPETRDVILRQSWRETSHQVELVLYRQILPQMPLRTAHLWAAFCLEADGSLWTVLEDLGTATAQSGDEAHRRWLLYALGQLHGHGVSFIRDELPSGLSLPRFDGQRLPFGPVMVPAAYWEELLRKAVALGTYSLSDWAVAMPQSLLAELANHPAALLHGDADFGNAVVLGGGVGLVDLERAMLGPPAFDIGRVMEYVQSADELKAYRCGFSEASGQSLAAETLWHWSHAGDVYNCLRWICYYIEATLQSRDLGDARQRTYEPLRKRLERLRAQNWPAARRITSSATTHTPPVQRL